MPYENLIVYGPYRREDGRSHVILMPGRIIVSYPKYLMELHLGRYLLEDEEVHHKDENVTNDVLTNFELINKSEHRSYHATKYFGPVILPCYYCLKQITLTPLQQRSRTQNGNQGRVGPFCSKRCIGKYGKEFQA